MTYASFNPKPPHLRDANKTTEFQNEPFVSVEQEMSKKFKEVHPDWENVGTDDAKPTDRK